jgi:CheY-like chemotaxis protein
MMSNNDENNKPCMLIVEDDFENQKLLEIYLRQNFRIDSCDSSETFYEKINSKKYDIFLMDISLRGNKNGLDLTRELRQLEDYKNVPIICITAHVLPQDKENAFAAGVDEFLRRPIYNRDLLDSVLKVYEAKSKDK